MKLEEVDNFDEDEGEVSFITGIESAGIGGHLEESITSAGKFQDENFGMMMMNTLVITIR